MFLQETLFLQEMKELLESIFWEHNPYQSANVCLS